MIYLAAYKGRTRFFDRLIQFWTKSPYSHCELVVGGLCYSSSYLDKGVREKYINYNNRNTWDLYPIEANVGRGILEYYEYTRDFKYSILDIIFTQIFKTKFDEPKAMYCSAWCAAALRIPNPNYYSPRRLVELIKGGRFNEITKV